MIIEVTLDELKTMLPALVLYAHIPGDTMDQDQQRAHRLFERLKEIVRKEDANEATPR